MALRFAALTLAASLASAVPAASAPTDPCTVVAYYFPGYHPHPRNDARLGKGWTEWKLVKAATPRFEGHVQPKVPAWGYEDESTPAAFEKKIAAAAGHGVDVLLFDWYWHEKDGPFPGVSSKELNGCHCETWRLCESHLFSVFFVDCDVDGGDRRGLTRYRFSTEGK